VSEQIILSTREIWTIMGKHLISFICKRVAKIVKEFQNFAQINDNKIKRTVEIPY
jgi:hypothetical protein